jgi:predicted transcriptional regulator
VQFVFNRANQNQRLTARLLGISRSTLARYLKDVPQTNADGSNSDPDRVLNEANSIAHVKSASG